VLLHAVDVTEAGSRRPFSDDFFSETIGESPAERHQADLTDVQAIGSNRIVRLA
jgi:hypothetical protein